MTPFLVTSEFLMLLSKRVEINRSYMKVHRIIEEDFPGLEDKIEQARRNDGRSLRQIVEAAGTTQQHWRRIEAGFSKSLPLETIRDIEQALGVDLGVDV